ncbi:SprT family zinc-dependent metalloprotease [Lentisphaerota bacterium WC36G]|nr:M48 family metallopeptidase [Lentisphaerae bacterium WC36]
MANNEVKLYDKLERSARRKRMAITVNDQFEVIVKASLNEKLAVIEQFVKDNHSWITAKKKQLKNVCGSKKKFVNGEKFYIQGEPFSLMFDDKQLASIKICSEKNIISIAARYRKNSAEIINKWYLRNASNYLINRAEELLILHKLRYQSIRIKETKSQWGSCSADGKLSFNWQLFLLPKEVIDYVIIHELAHLNELNHSALFWLEVEKMLPDYQSHRNFLRKNGNLYIKSLLYNFNI